jgi:primary-amine oxidase
VRSELARLLLVVLPVAAAAATHPLDPLSADEISATVAVLRSAHKITEQSRFPMLVLQEPTKTAVARGERVPRQAFVMVYERKAQQNFEAVVDISDRRLISWSEVKGVQAPLMIEDMVETEQLVEADAEWQGAMRKRGITDFQGAGGCVVRRLSRLGRG